MSGYSLVLIAEKNRQENLKPSIFELKGKKLIPCPFCESNNIYIEKIEIKDGTLFFGVCQACEATGPEHLDRLGALKRWQHRRKIKAGE